MFKAGEGEEIKLKLEARLTTQDPVRFVEIVENGQVKRTVRVEEVMRTGSLGGDEVLRYHLLAEKFWRERVAEANAK